MINKRKSIAIIGPAGVGKSLLSQRLADKTGLRVIHIDKLRHLKHLEELFLERKRVEINIDNLQNHRLDIIKKQKSLLISAVTKMFLREDLLSLNSEIDREQKHLEDIKSDIELRKFLPNLKNYNDMGFNSRTSKEYEKCFGFLGWHYYQKPFEVQLITELYSQLQGPYILDFGAGQAISLQQIREDIERQGMAFRHNMTDLKSTKRLFDDFSQIVYLKLPDNYQNSRLRASKNGLNPYFIESGQYDDLATISFDTQNMFKEYMVKTKERDKKVVEINDEKIDEVCSKIIMSYNQDNAQ